MTVGELASLDGFVPFQGTGSPWNTDISDAPVDPDSGAIIGFIGSSVTLRACFGAGIHNGRSRGIPYQVVAGTQPKVPIALGRYQRESDPGPMPIPDTALIQGYPNAGTGDRHVLVIDRDACWLYELFDARLNETGRWEAASAAVWDMTIDQHRPYKWTSADAAGLPIFRGLVRYAEVAAGAINHALRFTVPNTRKACVAPASHWSSTSADPNAPPMGTRLRLKAGFDTSGFSPQNRVILTALKKYGMILADNGQAIFISGAPDHRWNNSDLSRLGTIAAANFEVMQPGGIYTPDNIPTGPAPAITSFTAHPGSVRAGQPSTLNWSVSNSEYNIISPTIGPVRGAKLAIAPSATTIYTLYSTNQNGRTTRTATVTVK